MYKSQVHSPGQGNPSNQLAASDRWALRKPLNSLTFSSASGTSIIQLPDIDVAGKLAAGLLCNVASTILTIQMALYFVKDPTVTRLWLFIELGMQVPE